MSRIPATSKTHKHPLRKKPPAIIYLASFEPSPLLSSCTSHYLIIPPKKLSETNSYYSHFADTELAQRGEAIYPKPHGGKQLSTIKPGVQRHPQTPLPPRPITELPSLLCCSKLKWRTQLCQQRAVCPQKLNPALLVCSDRKESACNAEGLGSIPGSGRFP